jgi:hypothetical protein
MQSEGDERRTLFGAALAIWVGFVGLLRPGEILSLSRATLLLAADYLEPQAWAVAVLDNPKTRKAFGFRQFALLECPRLSCWLTWFFQGRPSDAKLFAGSATRLTEILRSCLSTLGVPPDLYSLSCLRAGGATFQFKEEKNLGALQFAGRWKSASTLHHYVQTSVCALQQAAIPIGARPGVEAFANFFLAASPP